MVRPLARDTTLAAEARQIALFRQWQPQERLAAMFDLSAFAVAASRTALQRLHPERDALALRRLFVAFQFGPTYAARIRQPISVEGSMASTQRKEVSFNITHHASAINIDVFVTPDGPFERSRYQRAHDIVLPGAAESIKLASPEDVILNKLLWFRQDGLESAKPWRDVGSVVRVQAQALDLPYLRMWASTLQVQALLEAALRGDDPPAAADTPLPEQGRLF